MEKTNYYTRSKIRRDEIMKKYNARLVGDGKYRVETKGLWNTWVTTVWKFDKAEDAIAYCNGEAKKDALRVIECEMDVKSNTLFTKTIYTKEVK